MLALRSSGRQCRLLSSRPSPSLSLSRPKLSRHQRMDLSMRSRRQENEEDEEEAVAEASGSLFEVDKNNFWDYLRADEQKGMLIVVDCYTEWCGPCKMIYPNLVKLSAELEPKARVVKFNCNKANKELGVELKIKVAPTFLLFQDGEKVAEMTGAKLEKLKSIINEKLGVVAEPAQA